MLPILFSKVFLMANNLLERIVVEVPKQDKEKVERIINNGFFATKTDFFRSAIREFDFFNQDVERILSSNLKCPKCGKVPITVILRGKKKCLESITVEVKELNETK